MSCKMKNIALLMVSCLLVSVSKAALAQGVVSLSEDAMFDDDLETTKDFPGDAVKAPDNSGEVSASEKKDSTATSEDNNSADVVENEATAKSSDDLPIIEDDIVGSPVAVQAENSADKIERKVDNLIESNTDVNKTITDDMFSKMSDIERSTTLLNMELRREKLQNEIEAVKSQRRQAAEQERLRAEELKQKQLEKIKEEERKKREEEMRLRELDIQFEKLRQEKVLKAYKNQMLEDYQKRLAHDEMLYKSINELRESRKRLSADYKDRLNSLKDAAQNALKAYTDRVNEHKNEVKNLNSQIDILRNRVVSLEKQVEEAANANNNFVNAGPGAVGDGGSNFSAIGDITSPLSHLYAITEIRGQGGELVAKLINRNGLSFYVKKGTALQSGHVVSDITSTYVAADKNFKRDFIYFSAGGILPQEIDAFEVDKVGK